MLSSRICGVRGSVEILERYRLRRRVVVRVRVVVVLVGHDNERNVPNSTGAPISSGPRAGGGRAGPGWAGGGAGMRESGVAALRASQIRVICAPQRGVGGERRGLGGALGGFEGESAGGGRAERRWSGEC